MSSESGSRVRRWAWPIALCAVLILLGGPPLVEFAFGHAGHGKEVGEYDIDAPRFLSPETAQHIGLKTAKVGFQRIEEVLEISGIVKALPDQHHVVISLIEGQVARVRVQVGDKVRKGDVLVEIQSLAYLEKWSQLLVLRAQVGALKLETKVARTEYERTIRLAGETVPKKEIAAREAELAKVKSELKLAEIETRQLEAWLEAVAARGNPDQEPSSHLSIRAPAAGVVVKRLAMPGQWIEAGETILETADYSTVQIEGELPESLIPRIRARKSNKVRVRIPSDPSFLGQGRLRFMAPDLDPVKRTAHLIVDVPNPKGILRGEMWVNLSVVLREEKEALAVPRSAVVVDGPMHFVFILNPDDTYKDKDERLAAKGFNNKVFEKKDVGRIVRQKDDGSFWILDEFSPAKWKPHGGQYQKQDIVPGYTDDLFVEIKDGVGMGDIVVTQGTYSLTQLRPKAKKKAASDAENSEAQKKGKDY